ncbi:MAG: polymer-forming cytoskeletal protein [Pontibacterium sp.]
MKIVGKMHIDGVFDGTITSLDNISIGKKGRVRGVIQARHINVSGLLEGEVTCDELHIEPDGLVQAIVASKQMSISPKGSFIGERRKWEQSGDETDIKALSSEADITESDAEKVLVNQE